MDLPSRLLPVLIGLLAIAVPAPRRGAALAGAIVSALALASLQVAGGPGWLDAGLAPSYFAINAALLALGLLLALGAGLLPAGAGHDDPWPRARAGVALLVLALGGYAVTLMARAGGWLLSLGALASVLAVVAGLWMAVRFAGVAAWVARLRDRLAERRPVRKERPLLQNDVALLGLHLLAVAAALFAPHLLWLAAGILVAAVSGWLLARRHGLERLPWGGLLGVVLLGLSVGAVAQVAGETSLRLRELPDGPFSPAFEPVAVLGLFLSAWFLLRLWPFNNEELGAFTPLAAAMLLFRAAAPVFPSGLGHWEPLFFPLLILASWSSIISGDWSQAVRAFGVAGVLTPGGDGARAGALLLAGEGLVALAAATLPARFRGPAAALLLLGMLLQPVPLLDAALRTQTFYTVLLAVSVALALVTVTPRAEARPAR